MTAPPRRRPPDRSAGLVAALVLAFGLGPAGAAAAQSMDLHGRLEVQEAGDFFPADSVDAASGARQANDVQGNLRLIWEPAWGPWSLSVHTVLATEVGPEVRLAQVETGLLAPPPATALELSETVLTARQAVSTLGLDRLSLGWSSPTWVIRVGRQALTWGSGLVFRPMDLFDPFSPTATDTEYKPGVDMLYVQRLFADGSDLQLIVAPRPPRSGALPTADDSSAALHLQTTLFGHRTTWLLARDHGDWVGALGVNGALAGATWNLEVVPTGLRQGDIAVSALANISDATTLLARNATVFAEVFHSGFGVATGPVNYAGLPPDLLNRLARGQLFEVRRDYLAAGLTLEANPLLTLGPTLIADLDDASLVLLMTASWSLGDNLTLIAGAQAPIGRRGTEFGGLPLTATSPLVLAAPGRVYVQVRRYF